jgi:HlyD family secretion protein
MFLRFLFVALFSIAVALGIEIALSDTRSADAQSVDIPQTSLAVGMIAAAGKVEPVSGEYEIAAEIKGRLKSVLVDEGDHVSAGQVVAVIDNADFLAAVSEAQSGVALRESELQRLLAGARPEKRREAEAALQDADAVLGLAKLQLERRLKLRERGIVSQEALDQTRAALASATAKRAMLDEQFRLITAPPRPEDVAIAEAKLAEAKAKLAEAQALLAKTIIRAPIDGTVLRRERRTGEAVTDLPLTTILRLGDIHRLRVRAYVDEADVAPLAVGQKVEITADAYPGQRFFGTVARVGASLGRKTFHSDVPTEKLDSKVLEVLIDLDDGVRLPVGLRVTAFISHERPIT